MKYIIFGSTLVAVAFLVGCAGQQISDAEWKFREAALNKASKEASQPLCSLECPESGCKIKSFQCNSPDQQLDIPDIPRPTNGWDFGNNVVNAGASVINTNADMGFMFGLGKAGFDSLEAAAGLLKGSGETHVTNVGDYSGDNAGRTGDYSGESSGRTGDYSGEDSGSTGDYSGPNSGNDGRIDSPNSNDGRMDSPNTDNSDNSTQSGGSPSDF